MFNLYQSVKQKDEDPDKKEPDVIGHDRFCQIRPSSSKSCAKKKKIFAKRSKSVAEFSQKSLRAAKLQRKVASVTAGGNDDVSAPVYQFLPTSMSKLSILRSR